MKTIQLTEGKLITGTAREILSLYHNYRKRELADSVFENCPKMNMSKNYSLLITDYDEIKEREVAPYMTALSEFTIFRIIIRRKTK